MPSKSLLISNSVRTLQMCFEETSIPLLHTHTTHTLISVRVMKPLPSTSQVRKNSFVLSSRAIGPQSELFLPGLSPKPFTLPSSSMSGTLQGTPGQQQCASSMYFSNSQEWKQTSGLLTGPVSSALGLLQSP